jgi:hypothetical protein
MPLHPCHLLDAVLETRLAGDGTSLAVPGDMEIVFQRHTGSHGRRGVAESGQQTTAGLLERA